MSEHTSSIAKKGIQEIMKKKLYRAVAIIVFILALLPLINPPPYVLHVLIMTLLFAYVCTAWSYISGYAKQVSLGHSAFFGLGAYSVALLLYHFNITPLVGMVAGVGASLLLALAIGIPSFKLGLKGIYYIFSTIALAELLTSMFISLRSYTGGALGLALPLRRNPLYLQFESKIPYYYIILGLWVFALFLAKKIQNSQFGYYLFAIREDEQAAMACGINVFKVKLKAHLLSAALTSIGGSLYAVYYTYVTPEAVLGVTLSFRIATTSLFGGATSWIGPTIGSFILTPALEYVRVALGGQIIGLPLLIYGILLMLIARFSPGGLAEKLFKGREKVL